MAHIFNHIVFSPGAPNAQKEILERAASGLFTLL